MKLYFLIEKNNINMNTLHVYQSYYKKKKFLTSTNALESM